MNNEIDGCIREINNSFSGLFKEIFNIIEVGLDREKIEPAKSLIGNKIDQVKVQCFQAIYVWFEEKTGSNKIPENEKNKVV
ncbi:MAG: hypothetical protein WC554_02915 [Clostridia bacterium]